MILCNKRNTKHLLIIPIIILSILLNFTPLLRAEEIFEETFIGETIAIVLLIDTSSSMLNTDPQMLRETASRIFIDLLSPEDYLSVITFDSEASVVVSLQQVKNSSSKEIFKEMLSSELQPRGNTDYLAALEAAYEQFEAAGVQDARPLVVFLTDGDPSPDPALSTGNPGFMGLYMESLWEKVDDFALAGIPIYTVAFSDEINPELTQKISLDTKGDSYFLGEPGELVVSFFELLGSLKNRGRLVNKTFQLQAGHPEAYEFQVDDYIRQVNLVAVNLTPGNCELSIIPPGGNAGEIEGTAVSNHQSYSMAVLSNPASIASGKWKAVFSGSGTVNVLGDTDLYIKGWLEEPAHSSQHPLNEPLQFKVKVTGADCLQELPLKAEIQLTRPGLDPVYIPLQEADGGYTGIYEGVDQVGTYELELRLLLEDQLISSTFSKLYVKILPSLSTDFWTDEGYRLGEEIDVTGSLNAGGKRLKEGPELAVESFALVFNYDDGSRDLIMLQDNGSQKNGDIKAGDGIWSNRVSFEKEGMADVSLLAVGEYMGNKFTLEKNLDSFVVHPPGKVSISISPRKYWSPPGRNLSLGLEVSSESPFKETILLDNNQLVPGSFTPQKIELEPGQKKHVDLKLNLYRDLEPRFYPLQISFAAEHDSTVLEHALLETELEIVTPKEAFFRTISGFIEPLLYAAVVALITLIIFYFAGIFLYILLVYPKKKIRGTLLYNKTNSGDSGDELSQKIKLGKFKKEFVVISFNPENKKADFIIKGSEFDYDIIIKNINGNGSPLFLQGWKALIKKQIPVKTLIYCTQPGILEFSGKIFSGKELMHSEKFDSGGFSFRYNNPHEKRFQDSKNRGVDILEGKV